MATDEHVRVDWNEKLRFHMFHMFHTFHMFQMFC